MGWSGLDSGCILVSLMYTSGGSDCNCIKAGTICSIVAAGNAFCQAAQLHLQLQSKHDAATCFVDAGNAFKKADPQGKNHCEPQMAEQLSTVPLSLGVYTDLGFSIG